MWNLFFRSEILFRSGSSGSCREKVWGIYRKERLEFVWRFIYFGVSREPTEITKRCEWNSHRFFLRRDRDSNPRYSCPYTAFRVRPDRPLRHLSSIFRTEKPSVWDCKYRHIFYFRTFSCGKNWNLLKKSLGDSSGSHFSGYNFYLWRQEFRRARAVFPARNRL